MAGPSFWRLYPKMQVRCFRTNSRRSVRSMPAPSGGECCSFNKVNDHAAGPRPAPELTWPRGPICMTERKPPETSFTSWVDQQIAEAEKRGAFDNLPGAGKPIPRRGGTDAWLRDYLRRE